MNSLSYFNPLVFLDLTGSVKQQRGCQLKKGLLPLKREGTYAIFHRQFFFSKTRPPRKQHHWYLLTTKNTCFWRDQSSSLGVWPMVRQIWFRMLSTRHGANRSSRWRLSLVKQWQELIQMKCKHSLKAILVTRWKVFVWLKATTCWSPNKMSDQSYHVMTYGMVSYHQT